MLCSTVQANALTAVSGKGDARLRTQCLSRSCTVKGCLFNSAQYLRSRHLSFFFPGRGSSCRNGFGARTEGPLCFEQGLEAKGLIVRRNCDYLRPTGTILTELLYTRRFAPPELPQGYKYEVLLNTFGVLLNT